jgi:hypothetical protein
MGKVSEIKTKALTETFGSVICMGKKKRSKAVPLHAMEALGGRGGIAPTHSGPWH